MSHPGCACSVITMIYRMEKIKYLMFAVTCLYLLFPTTSFAEFSSSQCVDQAQQVRLSAIDTCNTKYSVSTCAESRFCEGGAEAAKSRCIDKAEDAFYAAVGLCPAETLGEATASNAGAVPQIDGSSLLLTVGLVLILIGLAGTISAGKTKSRRVSSSLLN